MYQQPPGGNGWGGVQHAHQRIDELARALGDVRSDVATIKADMLTEDKFRALMDWGPRREERTYRDSIAWQNQQIRGFPAEQREQRNSTNTAIAAFSQLAYLAIAVAALLVALLKP